MFQHVCILQPWDVVAGRMDVQVNLTVSHAVVCQGAAVAGAVLRTQPCSGCNVKPIVAMIATPPQAGLLQYVNEYY